jgi:hypothetical protein
VRDILFGRAQPRYFTKTFPLSAPRIIKIQFTVDPLNKPSSNKTFPLNKPALFHFPTPFIQNSGSNKPFLNKQYAVPNEEFFAETAY